jgi:hypothetical protein
VSWLDRLLKRYRENTRDRRHVLHLTPDGFIVREGGRTVASVRWDDVRRIETFKVDLLCVDDIRVAFYLTTQHAGAEQDDVVVISEKEDGFEGVCEAMMERFPSIDRNWFYAVMLPAFATNLTQLYPSAPVADD